MMYYCEKASILSYYKLALEKLSGVIIAGRRHNRHRCEGMCRLVLLLPSLSFSYYRVKKVLKLKIGIIQFPSGTDNLKKRQISYISFENPHVKLNKIQYHKYQNQGPFTNTSKNERHFDNRTIYAKLQQHLN